MKFIDPRSLKRTAILGLKRIVILSRAQRSRRTCISLLLAATLGIVSSRPAFAQSAPPPPGTSLDASSKDSGPLEKAEDTIASKDFDQARSLLDPYLSAHPNDARALFDRGFIEDAQGRDEAAAKYYQKAIAADPKQFESHLALGLILARQGKQKEAREQLNAATQLEPNPPNPAAKAQTFRALAQLDRNSDPDAAKQDLIKALQISPETPDDILLTGEIAEAEGDMASAETAYRRALQKRPESSAATAGLAHVLIAQKKYSDAEPLIKAALTRDPDDPALNTQMALVLSAEGKQDEAVGVLEKLHQLKPDDASISKMLADAYAQGGQPDKASALYEQLLQARQDDPALLAAYGDTLVRQQKYAQALPVLQKAVQLRPEDGNAWSGLAFAALQQHQYQLVLDSLSARSKYLQETPASYFLWATAYDNLHHTKQAADYYKRFLAAANGQFPDQEWQAKHRLIALGYK